MAAFVLFVGILQVWTWLVGLMVERQRLFECTRIEAARPEGFAMTDGPTPSERSASCPEIPLSPGMLPPSPQRTLSIFGEAT
jgi:hypothetical protein